MKNRLFSLSSIKFFHATFAVSKDPKKKVHKILKTLEAEYDNKRLIRAVMEIIPHFYINLVLSLQNDNDNTTLSDIIEVEHVSKWNQIVNILDDERFIEYKQKLTLFNSIETWEGIELGERFDIINSLLTKQGIFI